MFYVPSGNAWLFTDLMIGLLMFAALALAALIFLDSEQGTELVRSYWYTRMRRTRFMRMLQRCGVGPRLYLNQSGLDQVRRAVHNCRNCPHHAECDGDLARAQFASVPVYCPNAAVVRRHLVISAAASGAGA